MIISTNRQALTRAIFPILLGLIEWLSGAGCAGSRVFVVGDDQVSLPHRTLRITAKLEEKSLFLKDIEQEPIYFKVTSAPAKTQVQPIECGLTDRKGHAFAELSLPAAGLYEITARYPGNERYQPGQDTLFILAVDPRKPILVLDLDKTLTDKTWLHADPEPNPYDQDTVRVVQSLSRRYAIVYLSSRPKPLHRRTRLWLKKYGFPDGPILLWFPQNLFDFSASRYKREQLIRLRESGINLAVGVSNTRSDIRAYQEAGLKTYIIGRNKKAPGAVSVRHWHELGSLLAEEGRDPPSLP